MHPYFHLFGKEIPAFGIIVILAAGAAYALAVWQCKNSGFSQGDLFLVGCMALVGALAGVSLIKPIVKLPEIIFRWDEYSKVPVGAFLQWLFGEKVFYGGLIGGFLAAYLFCRRFKMPFMKIADICAPAIPAGHAIGRIGCLMGGCCYGIEVGVNSPFAPFTIIYPERHDIFASVTAPAGVPLLAAPLIEAVGDLVIAAVLLLFANAKKERRDGFRIALYGVMYGAFRFVTEFFRGDLVRGVYKGVSFSQFISVVIVIVSAAVLAKSAKKADSKK